jgi:Protein of unknown function (DUF3467)
MQEASSDLFRPAGAIQRIGEAPLLYVNSAQIKVTPYDFHLLLGQAVGPGDEEGTVLIANLVNLVMSPQHAKAFAVILGQHVLAFEEATGQTLVIPEPANPSLASERVPRSGRSRGGARKKASRP